MEEDKEIFQIEFKKSVMAAVRIGLQRIQPLIAKDLIHSKHYNWYKISYYFDSGFPSFNEDHFDGPVDYGSAFYGQFGSAALIPVEKTEEFRNLLDFVRGNEYLRYRLLPTYLNSPKSRSREIEKKAKSMVDNSILWVPARIIDRYIYQHDTCNYSQDKFDAVYNPYARFLFANELHFDICIPILLLHYDFDKSQICPNVFIERIEDDYQLARAPLKGYASGVHDSVYSCATHMLVLAGWYVNNDNPAELSTMFSKTSFYPTDHVDKFFSALRILTGIPTGYGQLLIRPNDWAESYKAHLPPLEGTSIKKYPNAFENYYWNKEEIPKIESDIASKIGQLYMKILDTEQNSIHIAGRRLNSCFLRDDEQDAVIDATIGLEALLSDSPQEMTFKLAARVAALTRILPDYSKCPYEVYCDLKKIYDYRSAIVHGSTKADKKREIVYRDKERVPTSAMAIDYLRLILRILIENSEFRSPPKIDEKLLLGTLSNKWEDNTAKNI